MELLLKSASLRRALLVATLVIAAFLCFQAGEMWLAYHRIDSQQLDLMERGAALLPGNGEFWDRLGRYRQLNFENPDPTGAILDYSKAIRDDPHSALYWMDLASAYEDAGNDGQAQKAYQQAQVVYPVSAEVAWNYGNFLLRQQQYPQAYAEIQRAVRTFPVYLPLAISRVWRSSQDVNQLLDHILPADTDAYFQALNFFASIHQAGAGLAVWQRLMGLGKSFALERTFPYFDELIREDRAEDARRVWTEALRAAGLPNEISADHSLIWNGGFRQAFANGGLGWRWDSPLGTAIDFDSGRLSDGSRSIRVVFGGGSNLDVDSPSQYVPVDPARAYHFQAYLRTEGITTESGMRFSIVDPNHPGAVSLLTDSMTGSNPWTVVNANVVTGLDTHFLLVRLVRMPSRLFDNELSGTVWIADVSLVPSHEEAGQAQQ